MHAEAAIIHLSLPVDDLGKAKDFYIDLLGCRPGRSEPNRMDINFFGHHVVLHLFAEEARRIVPGVIAAGDPAPVRHFGAILSPAAFDACVARLRSAGHEFLVAPHVARQGTPGEQKIALVADGCGNVVEFKGMAAEAVFAV